MKPAVAGSGTRTYLFEQRGDATFGVESDQGDQRQQRDRRFRAKSLGSMTWLLSPIRQLHDFDDAHRPLALAYQLATEPDCGERRQRAKAPTFIERFGFYPGQFVGN
jgi:hypothetical protein